MRRPAYFFLTPLSLLLAAVSWSLAQSEGTGEILPFDEYLTGNEGSGSTELDTSGSMTLGGVLSGDGVGSGEGYGAIPEILPLPGTGDNQDTGNIQETGMSLLPSLIISEVFFDGTEERLELSNIGTGDFSGMIAFTGNSITASLAASINAGESLVIGRSGKTFSYIIDPSVIKYYASMGFTDTKEIRISLVYSGELLDSFRAETGIVTHYNDRHTSLEKIGNLITGTSLERQLNVFSGYIANPGSYDISFLYLTGDDGFNDDPLLSGWLSGVCQVLSGGSPLKVSEVFFGNTQRDFYVEILAGQEFHGDEIILSGSFLQESRVVSLAPFSGVLHQGMRIIISSGTNWQNEPISVLDNYQLAPSESGGFLLILGGSGQDGQVLDIVSMGSKIVGSSLYFGGTSQQCMRIFNKRGWFSPGFDELFLRYFPGATGYKIICNAPVATTTIPSPICSSLDATGSIGSGEDENMLSPPNGRNIHIMNVDYNPEGSDTNNEKITLLGSLESSTPLILQRPDRYIKIGTTKRYLSGVLLAGVPLTLQGSFGFPNTSTSGGVITVQLWYQNTLVDAYTYVPIHSTTTHKPNNLALTGTFLVSSVTDGDTFKIYYQTGEQSIRLLGLDAPEISLLRTKKLGCFAKESKGYLEQLLSGKEVHLEFDPTQNKMDSYKRRLNYVYADDLLINQEMIAQGYAKEYTFKVPYQNRMQFLQAQAGAQAEELGLRNPTICPENTLTGKQLTGEDEQFLSGLEAKILWIIPNPKGKDDHEQLALKVKNEGNTFPLSGFNLSINGKKKKIPGSLPIGEEVIISGSLGLLNKAACVSLVFQDKLLDTLCYPQPREGEKIYADGKRVFDTTPQEQSMLSSLAFKKKGNKLCMMFGLIEVDCRIIPSGKTALKTKNENRLYKSFTTILNAYLKNDRGDVYYNSEVSLHFKLLWAAKKNISAGIQSRMSSHGAVPVYDIDAQLHVLQTYSPAYRAKKFGQVLLNEI